MNKFWSLFKLTGTPQGRLEPQEIVSPTDTPLDLLPSDGELYDMPGTSWETDPSTEVSHV